ncbi:YxiG-like protein [Streptomyces microflavus]|uniref:YxiG-like protein n=1 Tax=Streptomyces microflavus TaxID=1919 RepID=UPI0033A3A4F2
MDTAILEQLHTPDDHLVVHHGYCNYMRDYELIIDVGHGTHGGVAPTYLRYLFKYCVEARCKTFQSAETWRASLDDRLLDPETADPDLGGYVWGMRFHELYGAELRPESEAARHWTKAVGITFRELHIETNAHDLSLVFSDLQVSEVPVGYAPFVARDAG